VPTDAQRSALPAAVAAAALAISVGVAVWVAVAGAIPGERQALIKLHALGDRPVDRTAMALGELTDLQPLAVVAAGVLVVLAVLRRWRDLAYFVAGVGLVWVVNPLLKELVARPRPDLWPLPAAVSEYSFPSGHAANSAAIVGSLILLANGRARAAVTVFGGVLVAAIGFSQLLLGRHYPTDVLVGWLWVVAWLAFLHARRVDRRTGSLDG
jgi:membrane-associated phospholipid phosphatase